MSFSDGGGGGVSDLMSHCQLSHHHHRRRHHCSLHLFSSFFLYLLRGRFRVRCNSDCYYLCLSQNLHVFVLLPTLVHPSLCCKDGDHFNCLCNRNRNAYKNNIKQ